MKIENERVVAGIACGEVLDRLSAYVDGELSPGDREQLEAHLRGCDACQRFGGQFRATVKALRDHLSRARPLPQALRERLRGVVGARRDG